MKTISILGSTGSIGMQTLDVVRNNKSEFKVAGLTTNHNIELLKKQIDEFKPEAVAVMDKEKANELEKKSSVEVFEGIDGLVKISCMESADTIVNSLVGSVGIKPTIEAIKSKKNIVLANKESLISAGEIIIREIKRNKVNLMPIDSEHNAIFQCLLCGNINEVKRIILTASGGPFKDYTLRQMENIKIKDALNHPTWKMGEKITIDSATLMNKGFEVIEAHYLFGVDYDKIEVLIHPQSIVHSMVEYKDNSVIAQLSVPDMKIPIQYALSYPKRFSSLSNQLNLHEIKNLSFGKADFEKFKCLKLAYDVGKKGGTVPAVLNAANEVAVNAFLDNKISFLDIPILIEKSVSEHKVILNPSLKQILNIDAEIKKKANVMVNDL